MAYKLDLNGHRFFLAGNSIAYEFDRATNQRTDVVQGTRYDAVDLMNGYEHLNVLVEGAPALLFDPEDEIPTGTEVVFTNLNAIFPKRSIKSRTGSFAIIWRFWPVPPTVPSSSFRPCLSLRW